MEFMSRLALHRKYFALAVLGVLPLLTAAQEFRSTITGRVTDPSGAPIAKAQVEAQNKATGQTYSVETTDSGVYFIPYVLPGTYSVTVKAPAFKTSVQDNVLLQAGVSTGLNAQLQIGTETERVEVTAAPPLIETANGSGGTVLTQRELQSVPLNGRQVYTLIGTTPGSQFTTTQFGSSGNSGTRSWDSSNAYTIGGGVQGYQQFTLDGTNITLQNQGSQGTWQIAPNVDALQEVNVMTSNYDARYGRTGGGTVNMVSKSGTNEYHGNLYEYLQNAKLNANNFQSNLNGIPRQQTATNQFGGTFGGPLKRNKIFFFGADEHYFQRNAFTVSSSVPPAYLRPNSSVNGGAVDFTQTGFTIFDPTTTVCNSPGGTIGNCPGNNYSRQRFPNNIIPASRINPIGAAVLNLYPLPNTTSTGVQNNYTITAPAQYFYYQPMVRLDYDITDKTRAYSQFAFQRGTEFRNVSGFAPPAQSGNINTLRQSLIASQDVTHIFSPSLLGDFKLSFTRFQTAFPNGDLSSTVTPQSIGLNMPRVPTTTLNLLPQFNDYDGSFYPQVVGNGYSGSTYNAITFDNDWTKTISKHTIHFGGQVQELQFANPRSVGNPNGSFGFGTRYSQYNPTQRNRLSGVNDGFQVADMLLGFPDRGRVDFNDTTFAGYPTWALYAQDDWKVTSHLTINVGLRYDVQIGVRERYNRLNQGICLVCVNPLTSDPTFQANLASQGPALAAAGINPTSLATVRGGLQFPGVNGNSRNAYNTDWTNLQPRFGFAYALDSKTVIRGGWGLFYAVGLEGGSNIGFSIPTPYIDSTNGQITPTNSFATGNPFPTGVQTPVGSSQGLLTALGNGASVDFPGRRIPRSQEVSFGFQRQLPGNIVLDARYMGNFTNRLRVFVWNNGTLTYDQLQQGIANPELFNARVPNPYFGVPAISPSSNCGSNRTIDRLTLLLPLSQYCGLVGQYNDPLGKQQYQGLEVKLNKRFSDGLSFQLSYTYSKSIEQSRYQNGWPYQDRQLQRQLTSTDRTHVFTVTGEYQLPFGKGGKIFSNPNAIINGFIGGWSVNWIVSSQTGTPTGLNSSYYYNCNHSYTPDGGPTLTNYLYNDYSTGNALGCYLTIPQYGLANLPQRIGTVRNPSITNLDLGVHKDFPITERARLQVRGEALNFTNTVLFPGPESDPSRGPAQRQANGTYTGFGTVNLFQQNFPRIVQLSLKLFF